MTSRSDEHRSGHRVPLVAVSMGDPLGIGPEIVAKALAGGGSGARSAAFVVVGLDEPMRAAAVAAGVTPYWRVVSDVAAMENERLGAGEVLVLQNAGFAEEFARFRAVEATRPGPSELGGRASMAFLEQAIAQTKRPVGDAVRAEAIVTAPISKTAWNLAGFNAFPGHTELLAARYGASRHAMLFVGRALKVILVTIHIPLARVPGAITTAGVMDAIELGAEACRRLARSSGAGTKPRVAVCGVNPHAGEGGLLGEEDDRVIRPAIEEARARGIDAHGPFPGDAVFVHAARGEYDLVVAMYHDQGLIPIKLLERERTVNVTVGLPKPGGEEGAWIVRTSPAHGTAFDIAGTNRASAESMTAAIELAVTMVQ